MNQSEKSLVMTKDMGDSKGCGENENLIRYLYSSGGE